MANKGVFISYSNRDGKFVARLVDELCKRGIRVWFDRHEIKVGDSNLVRIADGLEKMSGMVVVLSRNSVRSQWVSEELNAAIERKLTMHDVEIFPVRIDDSEIPTLLRAYAYADFRTDFAEGISALVAAMDRCSDSPVAEQRSTTQLNRQEQCHRMHEECYAAFGTLRHQLLLLATVMLETWLQDSWDENGKPSVYRPLWDMEKMADRIATRLLADPRSTHEGLESISTLPAQVQASAVAHILHFDRKLFVSGERLWDGYTGLRGSRSGALDKLTLQIIPSQWILAMSRFAVHWTRDVTIDDNTDAFFEYLAGKYGFVASPKDGQDHWARWREAEYSLKTLMFYERIGMLSPALFYGHSNIAEGEPVLYSAVTHAFIGKP